MKIAQILDGVVTTLYGNDPRKSGFHSDGQHLVDVSDVEGIAVGWSARRVRGQWQFVAPTAQSPVALADVSSEEQSIDSTT